MPKIPPAPPDYLYGTIYAVIPKKCKGICTIQELKRKFNESPYERGRRCTECQIYLEVPKNIFFCFCCGCPLRLGPRRRAAKEKKSRYLNKVYCSRCSKFYPRQDGLYHCSVCGNAYRFKPDNKNRREAYLRQLLNA